MADEMPASTGCVVHYLTGGGSQIRSVIGFRNLGGGTATNLVTAYAGTLSNLRDLVPTDASIDQLQARVQDAPATVSLSSWTAGTGAGTYPGSPSTTRPTHDACVVGWRTAMAGRANRGRTYLGPLPVASLVGQAFTNDWKTDLATWLDQLVGLFGPSGTDSYWRLAVLHRPHDARTVLRKVAHAWALVSQGASSGGSTDITSYVINPYVCTQRRRSLGVGM